jgi:hypothetical protein
MIQKQIGEMSRNAIAQFATLNESLQKLTDRVSELENPKPEPQIKPSNTNLAQADFIA